MYIIYILFHLLFCSLTLDSYHEAAKNNRPNSRGQNDKNVFVEESRLRIIQDNLICINGLPSSYDD